MAEDFSFQDIRKEYVKKEEDLSKNMMNADLINKILGNNKKRKTLPLKRVSKVLLPPCIVYTSNSKHTLLKVPLAFSFERCFPKPKIVEPRFCHCGNSAKYRLPKTLVQYFSLLCSKTVPNL